MVGCNLQGVRSRQTNCGNVPILGDVVLYMYPHHVVHFGTSQYITFTKKRKEKELTLDILGDSTRDTSLVSPFCDMRLQ